MLGNRGFLRLDHAFAYAKPPSSWPLPWVEFLTLAPGSLVHESRQIGSGQQEMARVNTDILGISELKWTGMGEFHSDDHYTYYWGQESLRRNGVAIMVNKRVWNAVLGCNLKNDRMISVRFQGKPFSITVIQVMHQPVTLKKLNGSMKTFKIF